MPNTPVPAAAIGLPPSRRGVVLGLAGLSVTGTASVAASAGQTPDPHIALAEEAVVLWRQAKALAWGWTYHDGTPEADAASAAQQDLMDHCLRVIELPPPETLPGLRALAVTMALLHEEAWTEELCSFEESPYRFLEQVLAMTGVVMPAGYKGLVYSNKGDA